MSKIDIDLPVTIDPKNEHVAWILRCLSFSTGPISYSLRKLGYVIPRRIEDEQTAVMMWMFHLHATHGEKWKDEGNKLLLSTRNVMCIVHTDRPATQQANVPCAPNGFLWVCDDCMKPEGTKAVFEAYKAIHGKSIRAFKQTNPGS